MCLTFFYLQKEPEQKQQLPQSQQFSKSVQFVIGFNRDQQVQRKTKQFDKFDQDHNIYAGRDSISGGTWLGLNIETGLMVILTNYDITQPRVGKSRGKVVYEILSTKFISESQVTSLSDVDTKIAHHLAVLLGDRSNYAPFNLVVYNIFTKKMHYMCSQLPMKQPILLNVGQTYGLCNCQIQVIWPKTKYGLSNFKQIICKLPLFTSASNIIQQMSKIFKDKKYFTQNLQDQSSIFVSPYYNILQKAQRMTKSTFYGVLQRPKKQVQNYTFHIKQVTYDKNCNQIEKIFKLQISQQKFKQKYLKKIGLSNK